MTAPTPQPDAERVEGGEVTAAVRRGEHTPTTDEIRQWATYVPDTTVGMHVSERDAAAFDRWLAAHDREVEADLLTALRLIDGEMDEAGDFDGINADAVQRIGWYIDPVRARLRAAETERTS